VASFILVATHTQGSIVRFRTTPCARRTALGVFRIGLGVFLFMLMSPCLRVAHADAFTIIAMPDMQKYPNSGEGSTYSSVQTRWAVDNRVALNVKFVTQLGDIVNLDTHWQAGWQGEKRDAAFDLLDGIIPYNVVQGNHDTDDSDGFSEVGACPCTLFLNVFGDARYQAITPFPQVGYGAQMSVDRPSFWTTFEAEGVQYLLLSIEYQNWLNEVWAWAQGVIDAHPGMPIIVTSHGYLEMGGRHATIGEPMWQNLIRVNPKILMVLNGHHLNGGNPGVGAEFHQVSTNDAGFPVIEMLANYQERAFGGGTWTRIIEVDRDNSEVNFTTYAPKYAAYETDANSQFTIPFDLTERLDVCNDGIDNNYDGFTDFPADTDCASYAGAYEGVLIVLPSLTASGTALLILLLAALGIPAMSARNRKPDA
jgi:hypothetical protein